jgi:hypothetical protein
MVFPLSQIQRIWNLSDPDWANFAARLSYTCTLESTHEVLSERSRGQVECTRGTRVWPSSQPDETRVVKNGYNVPACVEHSEMKEYAVLSDDEPS